MPSLNDRMWKSIKLFDIGDVSSGRDIYKSERIDGDIPYITSGSANNGIGYFVGNSNETYDRGFIAMNRNGAVGQAFYHPYNALMGNDCRKFHLKEYDGNLYIGQFIALVISNQRSCFSYSRKLGTARANVMKIMLPVDAHGNIDYKFMEEYIREIEKTKCFVYQNYCQRRLKELGEIVEIEKLDEKEWKEFFVADIFAPPKRGKRIIAANYIVGNMPVVSSAGGNNGVIDFAGNNDNVRIYEDCLSVANGGVSAGFAFYHPYKFIATDHVTHFKGDKLNQFHYLFIGTMIRKQMHEKYDFSREMTDPRLQREKIIVPVTPLGQPDYDYMEQYAKNMMIKKYKEYLDYQNI